MMHLNVIISRKISQLFHALNLTFHTVMLSADFEQPMNAHTCALHAQFIYLSSHLCHFKTDRRHRQLLETHLSTLITHRVMMEAVQHITSIPMNMLQNTSPKSHLPPVRSVTITNGITTMATDRSATARDTRR